MTDWTVVLTTAGAAVGAVAAAGVTAYFGYRGILRSTDVTKKQIEEETARTREQIEAENKRLRAQHREDHLRNRQDTYHTLLTADQALAAALGYGIGDAQEAFNLFSHLGNGIALFAPDAVKDAITAVLGEYVYVFREANRRAGEGKPSQADIRSVFEEHRPRIETVKTALVEAMREDVRPQ